MPFVSRTQRPRPFLLLATRLLVALVLLLPMGCERPKLKSEPGTAVVVPTLQSTWIKNFNPYFESQARWPTSAGIYEPAIVYNRTTQKYVPWLAEEWHWENENKSLVLKIREGVKWKDGVPLTAHDVAFTFALMKQHPALDQTSVWTHLDTIEVRGRDVLFHFKHPFTSPALYLIGRQPIVPEHKWKHVKDPVKFANPDPIGSGPFNRVLSFKPQMYEIGANPDYWQKGKPGIKKFRLPAFGGNESLALALIRGEIDWTAVFLPAIDRIFVAKDPEHHGYYFPLIEATVMLYANTTIEPLKSAEVRKAFSYAIDRKMIVKIAMQGYTREADATGFSDLYAIYHDPKVLAEEGDWTRYNPKKAEEMLDAAGLRRGKDGFRTLPDGSPLVLDLNVVIGWSDWIIAAEIMVKNLRAVGIDVTLRTYAFGAWFDKLRTGDFQLSMSWSDGAETPHSFYQRLMSADTYKPIGESAENNWQRFKSEEADKLLNAFAATADPDEQMRIASDLQRVWIRSAPAIPLFPGPTWGQYNTTRVIGFPTRDNPYAPLAPYKAPGQILAMVELHPVGTPAPPGTPGAGAPGRGYVQTPRPEKKAGSSQQKEATP